MCVLQVVCMGLFCFVGGSSLIDFINASTQSGSAWFCVRGFGSIVGPCFLSPWNILRMMDLAGRANAAAQAVNGEATVTRMIRIVFLYLVVVVVSLCVSIRSCWL